MDIEDIERIANDIKESETLSVAVKIATNDIILQLINLDISKTKQKLAKLIEAKNEQEQK